MSAFDLGYKKDYLKTAMLSSKINIYCWGSIKGKESWTQLRLQSVKTSVASPGSQSSSSRAEDNNLISSAQMFTLNANENVGNGEDGSIVNIKDRKFVQFYFFSL